MAVPTARPPEFHRGMTASAMKVDPKDLGSKTKQRMNADWQDRAFQYNYLVPELNFGSRFYSRMLKKIKIYPAILGADGKTTRITEGPPVDLLNRIQDPGGGMSAILGSYGRLMFITGEGYLLGVDLQTPLEKWQFVWNKELSWDDGKITWKRSSDSSGKQYARSKAEAYRFWTPAPDFSGEAESPMRAALEIAEELVLLTRAVRATATARMINGLLKVPAELSFGSEIPGADADPENNPYLREMLDHFFGVIENAGMPEAAMPFLTEGAMEFLQGLDWMKLHDPSTDYMEQALRAEAITRLAYGLDMPPEVLKGMTDANHWTAKQVMHDMWRSHGSGVAEQFCDDLSDSYLRPALLKEEYQDWDMVVVEFDDSQVVISPDRSEDARMAYDRPGVIKASVYRKLIGLEEEDAPDNDEEQLQIAIKFRDPGLLPAKYLPEGYVPASQKKDPGPPVGPDDTQDPQNGPPEPSGPSGVSRKESRSMQLQGAAQLGIIRCREAAGARIRSKFTTHGTLRADIAALTDGRPNHLVPAMIGQERIPDMDPIMLVRGGSDSFFALCQATHIEESQSRALAQVVEVFASKTLFEHRLPELPSGFAAQVLRAVEVSESMEKEIVDRNNAALSELEAMIGRAALGVRAS